MRRIHIVSMVFIGIMGMSLLVYGHQYDLEMVLNAGMAMCVVSVGIPCFMIFAEMVM